MMVPTKLQRDAKRPVDGRITATAPKECRQRFCERNLLHLSVTTHPYARRSDIDMVDEGGPRETEKRTAGSRGGVSLREPRCPARPPARAQLEVKARRRQRKRTADNTSNTRQSTHEDPVRLPSVSLPLCLPRPEVESVERIAAGVPTRIAHIVRFDALSSRFQHRLTSEGRQNGEEIRRKGPREAIGSERRRDADKPFGRSRDSSRGTNHDPRQAPFRRGLFVLANECVVT